MFFGHISHNPPFPLPQRLQQGLDFLRKTDFSRHALGKIFIGGNDIFAELIEAKTRNVIKTKPERHDNYIDIHFLISGPEYIGFAPDLGNNKVFESFMPQKDILFYENVQHEIFLEMFPGSYAIFFPEDIHRPLSCKAEEMLIRKVVVKIAVKDIT